MLFRSLSEDPRITEKKMSGGLAFLLNGKMCVGINNDTLMSRISPEEQADALKQPHVKDMDFTGRPMKGFLYIEPEGIEEDTQLQTWIDKAIAFVEANQ